MTARSFHYLSQTERDSCIVVQYNIFTPHLLYCSLSLKNLNKNISVSFNFNSHFQIENVMHYSEIIWTN